MKANTLEEHRSSWKNKIILNVKEKPFSACLGQLNKALDASPECNPD